MDGPAASFPLALDLSGRRVLIVGGGRVAARRAARLLEAGAELRIVTLDAVAGLREQAARGALELHLRPFAESDLDGAVLAFAATDDAATNARVVAAARARGVLANDASDGSGGDFTVPAVHRSGALTLTVDTGGGAPAFAKRVRDELARSYDERYARALDTLAEMRAVVLASVDAERRADVLARLASLDIATLAAPLVCATRGSALALWQTRHTIVELAAHGIASSILTITTKGDREQHAAPAQLGSDGIFVKELESALRDGRAAYAVHSCKDLPSALPADMTLAAVTAREDPRDAYCSERFARFEDLPPGAVVGTSSPRRRAQLLALRSDLRYEDIRGNVDTRLRKLRDGAYDAIVLAMAGLVRLNVRAAFTVPFSPDSMVPAAGQGALGIECLAADIALAARLNDALGDRATTLAVAAERALLHGLRAGCQAPVGAHAHVEDDGTLELIAVVCAQDGSTSVGDAASVVVHSVADAEGVGHAVAQRLLAAGAEALLGREIRPLAGRLLLLPRTREEASRIAPALRAAGADVVEAHDSAAARAALGGRAPDMLLFPSSGSVAAVGEYLDELHAGGATPLVAAMGAASAAAAQARRFPPDVVADQPEVGAFVQGVTKYLLGETSTR
jgi:hydroxymethylbilane synthase